MTKWMNKHVDDMDSNETTEAFNVLQKQFQRIFEQNLKKKPGKKMLMSSQ